MSDKTNYFEKAVTDYFFRPGAAAPTRPAQLYIGICTAASDTETPVDTECSYAGYARQAVTFNDAGQVSAGEQVTNSAVLTFPAVAGAGISITHYLIADALSGGNVYVVKVVTGGPIAFNVGDIPQFAAGAITHTET